MLLFIYYYAVRAMFCSDVGHIGFEYYIGMYVLIEQRHANNAQRHKTKIFKFQTQKGANTNNRTWRNLK